MKVVLNPEHIIVKELVKRENILTDVDTKKDLIAKKRAELLELEQEVNLVETQASQLRSECAELEESAVALGLIRYEVEEEKVEETI